MEFPFFFGLKVRQGFESRRLAESCSTQGLQLDVLQAKQSQSRYVVVQIHKLPKSPRWRCRDLLVFDDQPAAGISSLWCLRNKPSAIARASATKPKGRTACSCSCSCAWFVRKHPTDGITSSHHSATGHRFSSHSWPQTTHLMPYRIDPIRLQARATKQNNFSASNLSMNPTFFDVDFVITGSSLFSVLHLFAAPHQSLSCCGLFRNPRT